MKRRDALAGLGAAALLRATPSRGEDAPRRAKLAILRGYRPELGDPLTASFFSALDRLGWSEGRNLEVRARYTQNDAMLRAALIQELVDWHPDVLVTAGNEITDAVAKRVSDIPVVFEYGLDPVRAGWAKSLAQPGGNLTGITASVGGDLWPKRLQLVGTLLPNLTRLGALAATTSPIGIGYSVGALVNDAAARNIEVRVRKIGRREDIRGALELARQEGDQAIIVTWSTLSQLLQRDIAAEVNAVRLPSIYELREYVEAGGLLSHGVDRRSIRERLAVVVDKVLRGVKPADLPIEAPTRFELVINLKTAATLGLSIPPDLLAQADDVIE